MGGNWGDELIDADEFQRWIPPSEAVKLVGKAFSSQTEAMIAMSERLCAGMIEASAERSMAEGTAEDPAPISFMKIPVFVWQHLNHRHYRGTQTFWITNQQIINFDASYGQRSTLKLFGIRFEPSGVLGLIPPKSTFSPAPALAAETTPPANVTKNSGGRPRKEFWDDMLIAMFERLWAQKWQPKTQTEVENAMLDWASRNGHQIGSTAVKEPAKKLFKLTKS